MGSIKASFAVLAGFSLVMCWIVLMIDREDPAPRVQ
jgi:hypothetical protein